MSAPLTVVMPVYNEQDAIVDAVAEVQRYVLDLVDGAQLIVVNDGSRDETPALLDEISRRDPRVRVIHQANSGHGGAVMTGLAAATGDYVFLIDSDRQIPLDKFRDAWRHATDGRVAVFGHRRRRHDPTIRLYLTKLIGVSVRALFGVEIDDANVPYKLVRRTLWEEAQQYIPPGTLAPSLFLAIVTKLRGYDIVQLEVVHKERNTGEVSIRRMKLLKFCARGLSQMIELRRRLSARRREADGR
jgi:dolichol-phosphate mannosyltransferase